MANDELIWSIINHQFCSFKAKLADTRTFCRNHDNVTGQCDRRSCPLANSRYATIKEENGRAVLYVKTAERAHTPKKLWEKTVLSRNYAEALAKVTEELAFWPSFLVHKNKQRLTKIHQMLIRMRKLKREEGETLMETVNKKDERRERTREAKALRAAQLERSIEQELVQRLQHGTYGEIYNFPQAAYEKALSHAEAEMEDEQLEDDDDDGGDGLDAQRTEFFEGDVSDDDDDDDDEEALEDFWQEPVKPAAAAKTAAAAVKPPVAKRKRSDDDASTGAASGASKRRGVSKPRRPQGPFIEIEYETEQGEKMLQRE